jgi:hypothetical protein
MKIQPFHRMIPMSIRALRPLVQNGYVADAVSRSAYAAKLGDGFNFELNSLTLALGIIGSAEPLGDASTENARSRLDQVFRMFAAQDPATGQYQSYGFAPVPRMITDDGNAVYCATITGTKRIMFYVEIRERVLPAISVTRKLADRMAEFSERESREPNKKEIAMLKDQVKAVLLKNAPIRPKQVPIIIDAGICYTYTSSPTQLGLVFALLRAVFGTWPVTPIINNGMVSQFLRDVIATHDQFDELDEDGEVDARFYPGRAAKFLSVDSATTIKDERVINRTGYTAGYALSHGYQPVEADVHFFMPGNSIKLTEEGDPYNARNLGDIMFKIADNGVIKKLVVSDMTDEFSDSNYAAEAMGDVVMTGHWYVSGVCIALVKALIDAGAAEIADENDQAILSDVDALDDVAMGLRNSQDDQDVLEEVEDMAEDMAAPQEDFYHDPDTDYDPDLDDL